MFYDRWSRRKQLHIALLVGEFQLQGVGVVAGTSIERSGLVAPRLELRELARLFFAFCPWKEQREVCSTLQLASIFFADRVLRDAANVRFRRFAQIPNYFNRFPRGFRSTRRVQGVAEISHMTVRIVKNPEREEKASRNPRRDPTLVANRR